jgi:two-component system sensor histidine kinase ChvG
VTRSPDPRPGESGSDTSGAGLRRARRARRRWRPFASPLTRRILAVNLLAPIILVIGVFYLDRYKQALINAELQSLTTQAEMVAGAIGEGAVTEAPLGLLQINDDVAQQLVRRLAQPARVRARLFDPLGELAADSHYLPASARGTIQVESLPAPGGAGLWRRIAHLWQWLITWMPGDKRLPPYVDFAEQRADDYPEVVTALGGHVSTAVRARRHGIVLSVAVPVQRYKQVVAALMLTTDGQAIARSLYQVRIAIIEVFAVVLMITTLLSLYLAGTIARPIRRLAVAAEFVRHGRGRRHGFPDFSPRGDEIGELSVAFRDMTQALWSRMDAIEAFAADVAHEIKNPLTSLRSAVETAARVSDPDKQRRLLDIVLDDVERLDRLISDISDASRLDAELSRAATAPVDIGAMLGALAEVYRVSGAEDGPRFAVEVAADPPLMVTGIERRLVQVLRNLIANALSFSPPDGTIALSARRDGADVVLTIEDDGPGIPDNKAEAIFDRFYSERPEGEKFGTHSGLGLSISKQIVLAHNGTIRAENRRDADGAILGARFTVTLPAS